MPPTTSTTVASGERRYNGVTATPNSRQRRGGGGGGPRRGGDGDKSDKNGSSSDPFSHISIVHAYVSAMNADCVSKRLLICLRDHLPFVGIERGCDTISRFARQQFFLRSSKQHPPLSFTMGEVAGQKKCTTDQRRGGRCVEDEQPVQATQEEGDARGSIAMPTRGQSIMLFRVTMLRARRLLRGRRKLRALISAYAQRRRHEIALFVRCWSACEHSNGAAGAATGQRGVSFLEYSVTHVAQARKPLVAAALRAHYVHKWCRDMRVVRLRERQQSDNYYLWQAQHHTAITGMEYFAVKAMLLSTLRPHASGRPRFEPVLGFMHATMRDVVLQEARLRFGRTTMSETGMLRRLVIERTQRASLADPDMLAASAFLSVRVVPPSSALLEHGGDDDDQWEAQHPFFSEAPTAVPLVMRQDITAMNLHKAGVGHALQHRLSPPPLPLPSQQQQQKTPMAQLSDEANEGLPAPSCPSATHSGDDGCTQQMPRRASLRQRRESQRLEGVAISKTLISMVGDQWLHHPLFAGTMHAAAVPTPVPPGGVVVTPRARGVADDAAHNNGGPDRGGWRGMVGHYEAMWSRIRLQTRHRPSAGTIKERGAAGGGVDEWQKTTTIAATQQPMRPRQPPASRNNTTTTAPTRTTEVLPLPATTITPLPDAVLLTSRSVLNRRTARPSTSHARFYGSTHHLPFPAMHALGAFTVPSVPAAGNNAVGSLL